MEFETLRGSIVFLAARGILILIIFYKLTKHDRKNYVQHFLKQSQHCAHTETTYNKSDGGAYHRHFRPRPHYPGGRI